MAARLIDGRAIARQIWGDVRRRATRLQDHVRVSPTLAIVHRGDDPGTDSYLRQISRAFAAADLGVVAHSLGAQPSESDFGTLLSTLSSDSSIHGILVQLPLPPALTAAMVVAGLPVSKDVEGIHPTNAGLLAQGRPSVIPSTPLAGIEILRAEGIEISGLRAVVVGRSSIVGRPLALLLLNSHATVTVCHTRTRDLGRITRDAEVLFVAAGHASLVDGSMVKPGATVVDFGVNVVDGRLVGDVDFESVRQVAGAITPVPGGTGPVTTALLGSNLVELAERSVPSESS